MTDPLLVFALGVATGAGLVTAGHWSAEAIRQWRDRERHRRRQARTPVVRRAVEELRP